MDEPEASPELDGLDEPAALTPDDDHARLLSELDSHDLAFALTPDASAEDFRVDRVDKHVDSPDAERDVGRAFRVPEGETELVDVTASFRDE